MKMVNSLINNYNRNVSVFKMFHLIWAIIFIIKLYKSVANAPKKYIVQFSLLSCILIAK